MTRGGVVLTVNGDGDVVERQLAGGELACPSCGGVLGGWGNAGRAAGAGAWTGPDVELVPAAVAVPGRAGGRMCCCLRGAWPRRADAGAVIGRALEAKAAGAGHRAIAGLLGRPASTVRGWLRALARNAGRVRERFTALAAVPGDRSAAAGAGRVAAGGRGRGGRGGCRRGGGGGAGGGRGGAVGAGVRR